MDTNDSKISKKDIFKVHLLDNIGNTKKILVFCSNNIQSESKNKIFSNSEIEMIEKKKIEIIFYKGIIHKDDSISTIKKKIINEMGVNEVSYDELYLFINREHKNITHINIYNSITQNENRPLTDEMLRQLFSNMMINVEYIMNKVEKKDVYTYNDFISLMKPISSYTFSIPLGQKFSKEDDYLYSANPFHILSNEIGVLDYTKNSLLLFDNDLLFNYGDIYQENIYLCRIQDVVPSLLEKEIPSEYIFQTYYPLLYRNSIISLDDFKKEKQKLLKSNDEIINKQTQYLFDSIYVFYDIYYGSTSNLPYLNRGIKQIKMKIKTDLHISLPLEVIFKNVKLF